MESIRLIVVTGLSGSGKSIALDVLEDAGFYCIDNLPVSLFETFARELSIQPNRNWQRTAIGIDARLADSELARVPAIVRDLRDQGIDCEIVYLDADSNILIQRFSETRRRHPLTDGQTDLKAAIERERSLLEPLHNAAWLTLDTSRTTLHELRRIISKRVTQRAFGEMSVMLQSFGFKHGAPRNADFVFDARCLPNPHWQPELRPLTGRDKPVADFLEEHDKVDQMYQSIAAFLDQWIPCFQEERRSYLTIAIGCTGGQHRSVYLTERLHRHLKDSGRQALCEHRELS